MHIAPKEASAALQTLAVLEDKEGQDLAYIVDTHSKTENNMK